MKRDSATALATCLLLALFIPRQAQADVNTIRTSDSEVWGSVGAGHLDYKEVVPQPDLPDSEEGYIPSVAGGISYLDSSSDLYFAFETAVTVGNVHYNGALLATPTVPIQGTTQERIATTDGQVGMAFPISNFALVIPYTELGFRSWHRNLSSEEQEDYQHVDALAGLKLQVSPVDRLVLSAYGAGGTTFDSQMELQGITFNLGNAGIYKVGGKIGYDVTEDIELFTTMDYEHFRNIQSSVVDGAYEPTSYTDQAAARVGLAYHF